MQGIKKGQQHVEATPSPEQRVESLGTVLKTTGLEASKGLIAALYMKEITDPQWMDWMAWMKKYFPEGVDDQANAYA